MTILTHELDYIVGLGLNLAIIAVFILSAYLNIEYYLTYNHTAHDQQWRWIKLSYGIVSLIWIFIYVYLLFSGFDPTQPSWIGPVFVRPAIFLTGAIIASAAISRKKARNQQNGQS